MPQRTKGTTAALGEWADGDADALRRLWPHIYDELRALAKSAHARERVGHTLQPTAIVHEVYARLAGQAPFRLESRAHFFVVAARMIRRILVDHARSRNAAKRSGSGRRVSLEAIESGGRKAAIDIIELDEAIRRLGELNQRRACVVELRYFGGLTEEEVAQLFGVTSRTITNDWLYARAWLRRELAGSTPT
jgi:RNA polymerase sigma-70 factor, ECF subfamily